MDDRPQFWDVPLEKVLRELEATPEGLSTAEARRRREQYGPNSLARASRWEPLLAFLSLFLNPLVIILLLAAGISLFIGERVNAGIILTMVLLSVLLNYYQDMQAKKAAAALQRQVETTVPTLRDGKERRLPVEELVPGDVIKLAAGSVVPADARLLEARDLQVHEAALTGESLPVEKQMGDLPEGRHALAEAGNSIFFGSAVQSGLATAVVTRTGSSTAYGAIATRLTSHPPETAFDAGIRRFGMLIARVIVVVAVSAFIINIAFHRPLFEAFLFAVALAVGMTPELMPMVIAVTLAQGAVRMAKKKVIVKRMAAIENLGGMTVLCSDKTGTLTEGEIVLERHVNVRGEEEERILHTLYLNSFLETGIRSPLDDAILRHDQPDITAYRKVDEIPFDFTRRRLSVVIERDGVCTLVTKGEAQSLLDVCASVQIDDTVLPFSAEYRAMAEELYRQLSSEGFRLLAVATREVDARDRYTADEEWAMTLIGFGAFLDPPKAGAAAALRVLQADGIRVVILTGDNEYVTRKIAGDVELPAERMVLGTVVDTLTDEEIIRLVDAGAIFARVTPEQKTRIVLVLKDDGRTVGFLGDGINDAPSLHAADVGISVVNGVDIAKEAAGIILLEKELGVLHDGVLEGRHSFVNFMKFARLSTSVNFGNVIATAAGSLLLPFLPMLPTQIILNNLLFDIAQVGIPADTVQVDQLRMPCRWELNNVRRFMAIAVPVTALLGVALFFLLRRLGAGAMVFHTAWFITSLSAQTLAFFLFRVFRPAPAPGVLITILGAVAIGIGLTYTDFAHWLGFVHLPTWLMGVLAAAVVVILGVVYGVRRLYGD